MLVSDLLPMTQVGPEVGIIYIFCELPNWPVLGLIVHLRTFYMICN